MKWCITCHLHTYLHVCNLYDISSVILLVYITIEKYTKGGYAVTVVCRVIKQQWSIQNTLCIQQVPSDNWCSENPSVWSSFLHTWRTTWCKVGNVKWSMISKICSFCNKIMNNNRLHLNSAEYNDIIFDNNGLQSYGCLILIKTLHTRLLYTTLHYTTLHYTSVHYTTLHCTALHYATAVHYTITILHYYTTLHYIILHYTTLHYITLCYTTLHYTLLHYTTLHYTTLHYTMLHYTMLHYTTLCYTTLY